jgi:hypothetical protein
VYSGTTVEARSPARPDGITAVTDDRGARRFQSLPPGDYEVTATPLDYQSSLVTFEVLALAPAMSAGETISATGSAVQMIRTPNPQGIFKNATGGLQP